MYSRNATEKVTRSPIGLSILFLVLATIGSGIQYSNAVTKKSESGSEDIIDNIQTNTESQETLKHKSTTPDNDTHQSAATIYKNTSNFMSNSHAASITGGKANSTLNSPEKLTRGTRASAIIFPSSDIYKVTVTFDSITVNDNHEGLFSGDGEYNLAAYVQGIKVGLTDASEPANCAGLGCTGGPALLDVSSGETVFFKPGTEVSIDLPGTVPLSIFTFGVEVDSCGWIKLPEGDSVTLEPQFPGLTLVDVFKNPQLDWSSAIIAFLNYLLYHETCGGYDDNDLLGVIVKFYNPPGHSYEPIGWGAGSHTNVVSATGDYTLRYTITVEQKFPERQIESSNLSNKSQSNTFTVNKPN